MNTMKRTILSVMAIALLSTAAVLTSCKKEKKDNPPLIQGVEVLGTGPYTVTANIVDDNGALSVDLFYKKHRVGICYSKNGNTTELLIRRNTCTNRR